MAKTKNYSLILIPSILFFALISVFGLSLLTGNEKHSNVGTSSAASNPLADLNNDSKVDITDLSILITNWNKTGSIPADINKDNLVGITDLSILLSSWGAVTPPGGGGGGQTITHGQQLTEAMVGYQALGVTSAQLQTVSPTSEDRISTWPGRGLPDWIPNKPYVYNNDPNNHGGIVPAGGMMIDGFFVPAGVWVSQFHNYTSGMIVEGDAGGTGWPGIVFRGCRYRTSSAAPGFLNESNSVGNGKIWLLYNDMGGKSAADAEYNEVPIKVGAFPTVIYRNHVSYTTTGIQVNGDGANVLENLVQKLTLFYGEAGPPGESGVKHLNGFTTNGGIRNIRLERNKIILQSPDEAGHTIGQTDAISFFQDFSDFPGTGTNDNGTVGYQVLDNYVGGGGFTIYAGMNAGKPATSVKNMVLKGNKITTQWWQNGGSYGHLAAEPVWGSYGNLKQNNTWADGPKAGQAW